MRFSLDTIDDTRYLAIPMELFTHPRYAELDAMSKIIYGCLKSRMNLSKRNNWVEENGDIFFFMRLDELAKLLGTVKSNICKKLNILEKVGLLERQSCSESRSPKMYLHQVESVKEESQNNIQEVSLNPSYSVRNTRSTSFVSYRKPKISTSEPEVSCREPIYNNIEIQEENTKSINNNNREVFSDNVDVENFDKTVSEPLEPIGNFFRSLGIAAHMVEKILVKYTAERLREVIDILKMQTGVRNAAGFIVAALQFNYKLPSSRYAYTQQEETQDEKSQENEPQSQYVVAERPAMDLESPEIIAGVINTIEALYKRRGRIFEQYQIWLDKRGLTMVDGKVVAIA